MKFSRLVTLQCLLIIGLAPPAPAQLFENLKAFRDRVEVGDPETLSQHGNEGPKGIASADFNQDAQPDLAISNLDGTITVLLGKDGGDAFSEPLHLQTGATSLREIIAEDFNGDRHPDIVTAAPFSGEVFVFLGQGDGSFLQGETLTAWEGVRNVESGDFDGDGFPDLAVAGKPLGVRHYKGLGNGAFEAMGDQVRLGGFADDFPKPVYALRTIPSRDGLRDELLIGHAESKRVWVLGTQTPEPSADASWPGLYENTPTAWSASPLVITEFMAVNTLLYLFFESEVSSEGIAIGNNDRKCRREPEFGDPPRGQAS